ncbi:MAG: hypothetical protein CL484_06670 [Acidobacteria bacterium]|nr:hypothetical protein [Acidobacteriota bacterium]
MKTLFTAVTLCCAFGSVHGMGQPQWQDRSVGDSFELRLPNEDGFASILVFGPQGVGVGFEFPELLEAGTAATIRSIPGEQFNVRVSRVNAQVVKVDSHNEIDQVMKVLQTAPRLVLRVGKQTTNFATFGSAEAVRRCWTQEEDAFGGFLFGRNPPPPR